MVRPVRRLMKKRPGERLSKMMAAKMEKIRSRDAFPRWN